MLTLRPAAETPIHRQISEGLRMAVAAQRLAAGDAVPSVRALALRLGVNPNTVARAYRDLEAEGVLVTRRGRGTFVARRAAAGSKRAALGAVERRAREFVAAARQGGMDEAEIVRTLQRVLRKEPGGGRR